MMISMVGREIYQENYPFKIVEIHSITLANGVEYHRGDELHFNVEYSKEKEFPSETNRRIECWDGNLVTLTSFTTSLPLTGKERRTVLSPPMIIPNKVSDGECWFVFTEHTFINEERTETREFVSESFIVLPKL